MIAILALVAVAVSASGNGYSFSYGVSDPYTGDVKNQQESNIGGQVVGQYSLLESDGTKRVVDYSAGPLSGFNAVVRREGVAAHPVPVASHLGVAGLGYNAGLGYTAGLGYNAGLAHASPLAGGAVSYANSKSLVSSHLGHTGLGLGAGLAGLAHPDLGLGYAGHGLAGIGGLGYGAGLGGVW